MLEKYFEESAKKAAMRKRNFLFVRTHPSPVIGQIEDFLQRDFGPVPSEAIRTSVVDFGLRANSLVDPWLRRELSSGIEPAGQYLPTYHSYLLNAAELREIAKFDPLIPKKVQIHEATHGLERNINPILLRLTQLRLGPLSKMAEEFPQVIELSQAFRTVGEGFADWVGYSLYHRMRREDDIDYTQRTDAIAKLFADFEKAVDFYKNKWLYGEDWYGSDQEATFAINAAPYGYGIYFVATVMRALEGQGMSRREAANKLLLNPPTTMEELSDPVNFVLSYAWFSGRKEMSGDEALIMEAFAKTFLAD